MAEQNQCDDNEEVDNFNRFVSRIISGITKTCAENEVYGVTAPRVARVAGGIDSEKREEPLVELIKEEGAVRIVIELRGANRGDIRVRARPEEVSVAFSSNGASYSRDIALPCLIDVGASRATFKNGVLEVVLSKVHTAEAQELTIV